MGVSGGGSSMMPDGAVWGIRGGVALAVAVVLCGAWVMVVWWGAMGRGVRGGRAAWRLWCGGVAV
ncbi:MAG: hypothetical protein B7Z58_02900 [Acidiphilium sp. 37-64-53]|nr:MAG: hypothetical protein B7X01_02200 [Acidiphilium sp. 21-62-4]OYW03654.1 MAG: hypothetical protein B7Z58_02900 [Acidiphilium sp. 37-64-53]OZB29749.1 MAG: hypothetical protein B7X49_05935 [Acidiphilium sp. 34-64-41]